MTIEELEDKHFDLSEVGEAYYKGHTKLSIEFAIEVLKEIKINLINSIDKDFMDDKIQELKEYLK